MKRKILKINQTNHVIDQINLSQSVRTYSCKQNNKKCAEFVNNCVDLNQFTRLISSGYSLHHHFDFDKIKSNITNLVTTDDTIYAHYIHHDVLYKNKITNTVLKLPSIAKYCQFQYIFFDVDKIDFMNLIAHKLTPIPNIIYKPMSSSESKSIFRLVYIFDKQIPCKYYSDIYDMIGNELKECFALNNSMKFPINTLFGTDYNVYITNNCYYTLNEKPTTESIKLFLLKISSNHLSY